MGMDCNITNPNDKIIKNLTLDFARNSAKKSEDFFTVVRETDDGYVVRITKTDEKTGEQNVRKEFISRETFEAGIRAGYLTKVKENNA